MRSLCLTGADSGQNKLWNHTVQWTQQLWRSLISTCLELNQPVDEELKEGGRSSSPPRKVPRTEAGRGIEDRDTISTSATFDCSYGFRVRSSQANRQKFCCFRLSRFDDSGGENGRFIRKRRTEGESRKTEGIRWKHLFVVDQWVFFLSITFHFPSKTYSLKAGCWLKKRWSYYSWRAWSFQVYTRLTDVFASVVMKWSIWPENRSSPYFIRLVTWFGNSGVDSW